MGECVQRDEGESHAGKDWLHGICEEMPSLITKVVREGSNQSVGSVTCLSLGEK